MRRPKVHLARVLAFVLMAAALVPSTAAASASEHESHDPIRSNALPCETFQCFNVAFAVVGDGSGTLKTTDSAGNLDGVIDCRLVLGVISPGSTCSNRYVDTQFAGSVTLYYVATPDVGYQFCLTVVTPDRCRTTPYAGSEKITFDATIGIFRFIPATYVLGVSKSGSGSGTVTSSPAGITCGATCQVSYNFGTSVTLFANADTSSSFTGWTGACAGQDLSCELTIPAGNVSTTAIFALGTPTPTPTPSGGLTLTTSAPIPPGAKDPVILWGQGFTLAIAFPTGGANRLVALEGTRDGATWSPIGSLTTDSNGRASLDYRPVTNLFYRAVFAGGGGLPAATSNQVRTTVRQLAVMRPTNGGSTRTITRGTSVTFTTTVRPSRPELAPPTVSFYFSRQVTKTVVDVIRRDVAVDSAGVARTTFDFPISGTWSVRSQANPTPYNANSLMTPIERYRVN